MHTGFATVDGSAGATAHCLSFVCGRAGGAGNASNMGENGAGSTGCVRCPVGKWSLLGFDVCRPAPSGTFCNKTGTNMSYWPDNTIALLGAQ